MVSLPIVSRNQVTDNCGTCHSELASDQGSWFVPWGEHTAAGRRLCFQCLMTSFRIDTQAQGAERRAQPRDYSRSRPLRLAG